MHCLSQPQFSRSQLVSSTSLQNNTSLPSLKQMGSSDSHSSSIPPQKNVKRSLNDFKQLEDQKCPKKHKKDDVSLHLDSKKSEVPVVSEVNESVMSGVSERENLKDLEQRQEKLHCMLKPRLKKLCEILKLPDNVTGLADSCLGYVMNNHQVEVSKTSLQAFLISLCWIATSLLKYKLHHKESIALAKKHLKFRCRKEEAEYAYYLLRCLRRVFLCFNSPKAASKSQGFTIEGLTAGREISDDKVLSQLGLTWKDVSKSIADVKKKFDKKKKELLKKQEEELQKLNRQHKAEMSRLERWKQTETVVNRRVYGNCYTAANKREWLDKEYDKKLGDLEFRKQKERKNLEEGHLVAQKKLQERVDHLLDGVKSWAQTEFISKPVLRQIVDIRENLKLSDVSNKNQTAEKAKSISDRQGPDEIPAVPHSNEDEGGALPTPEQSFSDHQNVHNVNASSCKELNFDVPVTLEVTDAVGSGVGKESTLNKPSLKGQSLDEPTAVKHDVGSTRFLEKPASSSSSPSGKTIPSTHGKSSLPAENVEAAAHDNVSIVVEADVDTHDIGQYRANETIHEKSRSGERLPEPTSCEVVESSKNGKHNGYISADRTLDNQNIHSSEASSQVNNQNREDSLDKHDTAAGRAEGSGNDVLNAPELSASGRRAEDGSSGGEGNVACAVASQNFTGAALLGAECASTTARLQGVLPQSGSQNASRQVEAASAHPQDDSDHVRGGTQTSFEGHVINNSGQSPAEWVDNQVEHSHQADAQQTTRSFQQTVEIPRPGSGRHVSVTTARLQGVLPQSGSQNASRQVEAASSHPQDDSDCVRGTQTSFEGHMINNFGRSPAEWVDNQVEHSHQADAQHTTHSFQQTVEIPTPGSERHVSVTTVTPIPPPMVNNFHQATPLVQMYPQSSKEPVEIELARITKERDQVILMHKQAKLRLNSEREKEIDEIHRKYDAKLEENESEFLLKKKELDANYQIVLMNNVLAKAFRWKEVILLIPSGTQPDFSSFPSQHYIQQVTQLAAQNTALRPPVVNRPPQLSLMSPGNLYIGSVYRATMPHLMTPLRQRALSAGIAAPMPHLLPPLRPQAQGVAAPMPHPLSPLRPVAQSAGVAAPMPHPLPPLRPRAQSAGVAAPMPPLGLLAPSAGIGIGFSYPACPMPGQWVSNIPCATSPLFSRLPSPSRPSTNPSGFQIRAHQPEAAGVLPSFSSLSLLDEWLMNLDNQANISGNPPSNCQQQIVVPSNSYPLAPLLNIPPRDPLSTDDIVHLSDDD